MHEVSDILGPHGPLARRIARFAPRVQQQAMANAVAQALGQREALIVEAGTGIGKTFAYLVPVLLSGEKTLISTGTRTLQDQLYHRDLPTVRDALGVSVRAALLKGRANYLCLHRLDVALFEGRLRSRELLSDLERVRHWAAQTRRGDIAEVSEVPEDSSIWPLVTSTTDNCLGQDCPSFGDCYVVKARRQAQEADLVVINHHLLFADMALREDGFGELLPGANAFILDEAHQLPDVAASFFGVSLSGRQLTALARDTLSEHVREAGNVSDVSPLLDALEKAVLDFRLALGTQMQRTAWSTLRSSARMQRALRDLGDRLESLCTWLETAATRGKGLDNCWRRSQDLARRLELLAGDGGDDVVQWVDVHRKSFVLHITPLNVAPAFQARMQAQHGAWIFTSATLAVGDSFSHFARRLGIEDARTERLDSPFNFQQNALLYLPKGIPDPSDSEHTASVVRAALPAIEASDGGAFLLFTSHRALQAAAALLRGQLSFPLLVQGEAPRGELLDRFRSLGNAVLLGTSSFWEGVDVRGPALSLVIIDKLPFASPGDPVLQARIDRMRRAGGNPFMDYQVPSAVIALKQGVGRLIRDIHDRGVMMLCDPRLVSKPYGRMFLASLPAMRRTRELNDIIHFFHPPEVCADVS